mgnify:CR=1 FL=1
MKRLTYFKNGHWRLNFDGCQYNARFVDRLAAYENTGLMPGEVAELQALLQGCESKKSAEWVRLQELAEADKAGRVMVLPCKVGDTVWVAGRDNVPREMQFDPPDIRATCTDEDNLCASLCKREPDGFCTYRLRNDGQDIGKTVFLTREEAEEKLKEVQKDNGKSKLD